MDELGVAYHGGGPVLIACIDSDHEKGVPR